MKHTYLIHFEWHYRVLDGGTETEDIPDKKAMFSAVFHSTVGYTTFGSRSANDQDKGGIPLVEAKHRFKQGFHMEKFGELWAHAAEKCLAVPNNVLYPFQTISHNVSHLFVGGCLLLGL